MNFGLNVSYLGLFVLKKIGNQHQIYFFLLLSAIALNRVMTGQR